MTQSNVTSTQGAAQKTGRRQQKVGRVVSNKMDRTYKQTKRFHAHDEQNACQVGDLVRIEESRPLSKLKRWRLVEIVKPGSGIVPVAELLAGVDPDLSSAQSDNAAEEASEEEASEE